MQSGRSLLQYFSESDLQPATPAPTAAAGNGPVLLYPPELDDVRLLADDLTEHGEASKTPDELRRKPHLRAFLAFLKTLGAVRVDASANKVQFRITGRLARHVPQILYIYLNESLTMIDDWKRTHLYREEGINGLELLRQMELRRIEQSLRAGRMPRPLANRPVAFAIFHARDQEDRDCYLFEVNKDWRRLNFIGGKQEEEDAGSFEQTVLREIGEELDISRERLSVTRLNQEPLLAYSLSGNVGSLASYPCVLFGVRVTGAFQARSHDRWLTEPEIRACFAEPDCPLMVNPTYLHFLLDGKQSKLSKTPLSISERVVTRGVDDLLPQRGEERLHRWSRVLRENKDFFAAILTIIAAAMGVVLTLRG